MNAESQKALKVIRVAANKTGREQNRIDTLGIRDIQYMTHLRPKLHTLGHDCLLVPIKSIFILTFMTMQENIKGVVSTLQKSQSYCESEK